MLNSIRGIGSFSCSTLGTVVIIPRAVSESKTMNTPHESIEKLLGLQTRTQNTSKNHCY